MKGAPAVANIVSRFERPANVPREIAGALRAYGLPAAAVSGFGAVPEGGSPLAQAAASVPAGPSAQQLQQLRDALAASVNSSSLDRGGFYNALSAVLRARAA